MSLRIVVTRSHLSLQYKRRPSDPSAWDNNDTNNSLDQFALFLDDGVAGHVAPLFVCRAQTVANLEGLDPDAHYSSTLAPGAFQLRAFVDPLNHFCHPHGICNAKTLGGAAIGADSLAKGTTLRWLMHDWQFPQGMIVPATGKPSVAGQDTRFAQSAGCIVVPDADLDRFGAVLLAYKVNAGDLIDGELVMEG